VGAGAPVPGGQGRMLGAAGAGAGRSASQAERFLSLERERQVVALLHRHGFMPLAPQRILEVGCGDGKWLRDLIGWGADPAKVHGVELLPASAARARRLCPPAVTIECSSATNLRFPSQAFDIVLQATVFSAVLDNDMRHAIAAEMRRVVRPGGLILWYDLIVENPWNSSVHPLRKSDIRRLFPDCSFDLRRTGLAPSLARLLAGRAPRLASTAAGMAPFCTHFVGAIRPAAPLT
jgi:ubiquinone/menaquinone biosynthesis C-methylase UbiE